MDVIWPILGFVSGLALLWIGAELLVKGSVGLARAMGVSPFVIGLTVVSIGTSAPELSSGIRAVLGGIPGLNVGNVVGSNIANILLILGVTALVCPIPVRAGLVRKEVPIMIGVALAGWGVMLGGMIGRFEGALLLVLLVVFLIWSYRQGRRDAPLIEAEVSTGRAEQTLEHPPRLVMGVVLTLIGLVMLKFGADLFVDGAIRIARHIGVSDVVIGKTVVAFGTSVPELAASVAAALRRHPDIAIGNVLGSNVFNVLCVLGVTALIAPLPVSEHIIWIDMAVVLGASLACIPIMWTSRRITRVEGVILIAGYLAYVAGQFVARGPSSVQ